MVSDGGEADRVSTVLNDVVNCCFSPSEYDINDM